MYIPKVKSRALLATVSPPSLGGWEAPAPRNAWDVHRGSARKGFTAVVGGGRHPCGEILRISRRPLILTEENLKHTENWSWKIQGYY